MNKQADNASDGAFVTKEADGSVSAVLDRLTQILESRGMKVFTIIDHSGEAQKVGLELRETRVVIFGKPESGTGVMESAPLAALDLPLKVLIWDDDGKTKVSYTAPMALARRHGLSKDLAERIAGIDPITDTLVASA